jgi:hypothetical protein
LTDCCRENEWTKERKKIICMYKSYGCFKKQYEETSEYQIMVTQLRCQFPISLVGENNLNTVNAIQAVLSNGNVRVHVTPRKKNSTNPKL